MRVMLGDQEWFVLSGLEEIKQFSMTEESTHHLPSKTFNDMYSFDDRPLGKGATFNFSNKFNGFQESSFLMAIYGENRENLLLKP